jgi:hypothetical protein
LTKPIDSVILTAIQQTMLTMLTMLKTAFTVIKWIFTVLYTVIRSFLIGFFTVFIAKTVYFWVRDRGTK